MFKVKVLEAGHVIQEISVDDAMKLVEEKLKEGQSVIVDGIYTPPDAKNIKQLVAKSKQGISFFPMIGGGNAS